MLASARYPRAAALLHWFTAVLVLASLAAGWYAAALPLHGWQRVFFFDVHQTTGIFSAVFIGALIGRRLLEGPAPTYAEFASMRQDLRSLLHALLYVLLVLATVSGYLSSAFSATGVKVLGVDLAPWGGEDPMLRIGFAYMHQMTSALLGGLIVVHVVEAAKYRRLSGRGAL